MSAKPTLAKTLKQRGTRYGTFAENARVSQNLQAQMHDSTNWAEMSPDKKEALTIIQHKIARILTGDAEYDDSWHDIGGYAKLVEDTLNA